VGRIHLPVASKCNIACNYCNRKIGIDHCYRPSIASRILAPREAYELLSSYSKKKWLKVAGIAGPGEPLFNSETFETLKLAHKAKEELILCICTNGLLLPDYATRLAELGVKVVTITINAVQAEIAMKIYTYVKYRGRKLFGIEASKLLISKQLEGIEKASQMNMLVRVNSILIPTLNDKHMIEVAKAVADRGANIQNIMPLIPLAKFKALRSPSLWEIQRVREKCEHFLPQFKHCKQCRADSIGIPGLELFKH
jgi:nitrogen fixation protein NifB